MKNVSSVASSSSFLLATILSACLAITAAAQTSTGNIRGTVTDAQGAPVADAQVAARDVETNVQRSATTSAAGFYYLGGLRPARYELTVRRLGFQPQTRTVQLQIGQTLDIDFQTGQTSVQLEVVETVATRVETRTSEVATNVSQEQISCELSGEVVVLSLRNGEYFGLNPVAASIWTLIQSPRTVREVRDELLEQFGGITPEQCALEVLTLLEELRRMELLEVVEQGCPITP